MVNITGMNITMELGQKLADAGVVKNNIERRERR